MEISGCEEMLLARQAGEAALQASTEHLQTLITDMQGRPCLPPDVQSADQALEKHYESSETLNTALQQAQHLAEEQQQMYVNSDLVIPGNLLETLATLADMKQQTTASIQQQQQYLQTAREQRVKLAEARQTANDWLSKASDMCRPQKDMKLSSVEVEQHAVCMILEDCVDCSDALDDVGKLIDDMGSTLEQNDHATLINAFQNANNR